MQQDMIFGMHALEACLNNNPERIIEVFVNKERNDKRIKPVISTLQAYGLTIQWVNRKTLDKKAQGESHQGIIARVHPQKDLNEHDLDKILDSNNQPFLLILDNITDPHNLGACLRSADAAGVDAVIVPKDKSAQLTAIARKIASGAAETIPFIRVTNLARTMRHIQQNYNIWIIGTAGEAVNSIYEANYPKNIALVMGAEGDGMRRLTRETCDELIKIPMFGSVSSLNVSVATGICLFEITRNRINLK